MASKFFLQDLYFRCFNEHFFTTIGRIPLPYAAALVRMHYGTRPWTEYPLFSAAGNRRLLFIHIPKCGGTSVARAFGLREIRHLPAAVFSYSNPQLFSQCTSFAILRNPRERLESIIRHLGSSVFATEGERAIYEDLQRSPEAFRQAVMSIASKRGFYRRVFCGTNVGRSGFSVNQLDYVTHQKELLVKNLFTLNNIEACEEWLTAQCGRPIRFPKENISSPFRDSDDSGSLPRELLKHEWDFYDLLQSFGGHVTEDTTQQKELARYLRGL